MKKTNILLSTLISSVVLASSCYAGKTDGADNDEKTPQKGLPSSPQAINVLRTPQGTDTNAAENARLQRQEAQKSKRLQKINKVPVSSNIYEVHVDVETAALLKWELITLAHNPDVLEHRYDCDAQVQLHIHNMTAVTENLNEQEKHALGFLIDTKASGGYVTYN